jgi:hypothetical protein
MNRLEVKTSKVTLICAILLGLFCIPMAAGNLSRLKYGLKIGPIIWALVSLSIFVVVLWLARRGHARSVKVFTEEGLTRNDGVRFSWADLSCVVDQIHRKAGSSIDFVWRIEVQFNNGQYAWLITSKVANFREVRQYVDALPCEHKEVRV